MKAFTKTRNSDQFWETVSVNVGRGVLIRFAEARKAFYRRCKAGDKPGYPRFKSHHRYPDRPDRAAYAGNGAARQARLRGPDQGPAGGEVKDRAQATRDQSYLKAIRITFRGRRPSVSLIYAVDVEAFAGMQIPGSGWTWGS